MSDYELAIKECKLALDIDSKFSNAYDLMVKCYLTIGVEVAIQKWEEFRSNSDAFWDYKKQFNELKELERKALDSIEIHDFRSARK